ncbi:MAG: DUF3488 domain-containing protein [Gammaproteobacteria bacterium]|nr:DUF3488 domain-containing protein [Gammaproteobacteria bacterium]
MTDAVTELPIQRRLLRAVLVLLSLLMAPHAANLHPAILGFFYAAVGWRFAAMTFPRLIPGRWLLLTLMIGAMALVVTATGLVDGRVAGTALLVVMLGLKLLEIRARRDMHVTVFLGYFLVLTQFLYDQSLWLALYSFIGVVALVGVQVGLNRVKADLRLQLNATLALVAAAAPLAIVVFLLFPRLHTPLWGINTEHAVTGISDEMSLGSIGQLSRSNATAFRVRFFGEEPAQSARYWRGPVLWETDGSRWTKGRHAVRTLEPDPGSVLPIDYEITLEPTGEYWLFGLDVVTGRPAHTYINSNYSLVAEQRVHRRFSYRASSDPGFVIDQLSDHERLFATQLPDRVSPRIRELVDAWQRQADAPAQVIEQALRYFREQPFVYTLSPGELRGDAIDSFLFETRRGFCEHYAGSFALLMRVAGLPSRVVIGYQGGEKNPHADHWVVRQSDAHAWTEVWLEGNGWVRIDPTAAVAPERIEQPIDAGRSEDADRVVFNTGDFGLLGSLWLNAVWMADAIDIGWYRWVVDFTADRQNSLLEYFGLSNTRGYGIAIALIVGSAMTIALVYLVAKVPRPRRQDPLPLLWRRFVAKLQHRGLKVEPWHGPDTVCAAAGASFPNARAEIKAINRLYVQLRYGRRDDRQQVGALRQRIRRLRL